MKQKLFLLLFLSFNINLSLFSYGAGKGMSTPRAQHPKVGMAAQSDDNTISIKLIAQKHNFGPEAERDHDIYSPKSVNIHPDGTKYYVNSLEGYATVVYEMGTNKKLKVISHKFTDAQADLWAPQSKFYEFTHYPKNNACGGKPVEATFSHNGRYLWVPYYHRDYDINSQDPSAVCVIDTKTDEVIRLFETGPLPKMIATSHKGNQIAISHWGDNTIGLIDASSNDPQEWHHKNMFVVDKKLVLNFSTKIARDRDNGSGNALRGTVFTPDDRYLFVSCMGGSGGIAVVDLQKQQMMGKAYGMSSNIRHMLIKDNWLYLSINAGGKVQRIKLDSFINQIQALDSLDKVSVDGWETAKVGTGARTIEISPSGKYVFAACNNASIIGIVDTRKMEMVASIPCDSYPVGLALSRDGKYLIATSQGRNRVGGNAVNIFEVNYAEDETPFIEPLDTLSEDTLVNDTDSVSSESFSQKMKTLGDQWYSGTQTNALLYLWLPIGILAMILIIAIVLFFKKKSNKPEE